MAVTKISLGRQSDLNAASQVITNVANGSASTDAVNKGQLDAAVVGYDWKPSVRVATTAQGAIASAYANAQVVDGVTLATNDRILIKDQTAGGENGIYTVNASGAPTRSTDADTTAEVTAGLAVFVEEGTVNADTGWIITNNGTITVGTTALVFTQFSGIGALVAGTGLTKTGNTVNVGAGLGILANADDVAIDTTVVSRKADFVDRETPTGLVNGSNTSYVLANTPVAGSEHIYLNGLLQEPGAGNDYTIATTTITYLTAPVSGDKIRVSYRK